MTKTLAEAHCPQLTEFAEACPATSTKQALKSSKRFLTKSQRSSCSSSSVETHDLDQNNNQQASGSAVRASESGKLAGRSVWPQLQPGVRFKYQSDASGEDLHELRKLIVEERHAQMASGAVSSDELDFYSADFNRMMTDDWLVTRFLLRGKKYYERQRAQRLAIGSQLVDRSDDEDPSSSSADDDDADWRQRPISIARRREIYAHTMELIKVCAKFRYDYRINGHTQESEFPTDWLKVNGLFDYEPDRAGNPTVYLRVALHRPKMIEMQEARHQFKRFMLLTLERCDQRLYNKPGKAICCIFDMTNVAFENIDLELTSWMIKSLANCSPKLLCYVIVYNPPWFFTATFKLICNTLLSSSKRRSVKFVSGNEILKYIEYDKLPDYVRLSLSV